MSTPEAEADGLGFRPYVAPDILGSREDSVRFFQLPLRPNYLCIHHAFELPTEIIPSVLTMRGSAIDKIVELSKTERAMTITFTPAYDALLREQLRSILDAKRAGMVPPSYESDEE
jgi:hypothetical protein